MSTIVSPINAAITTMLVYIPIPTAVSAMTTVAAQVSMFVSLLTTMALVAIVIDSMVENVIQPAAVTDLTV